jgi:DNA-binding transcriptional ArsR family regulator
MRQTLSRPLVEDLQVYMREQLAKLSRGHDLAKTFNYILKRWASFTRFLEDGRVCLSNNAAERGLRGIALGRKSWLFCGSDRGGRRAASMYSLIITAKMNGVDPQAWLTDNHINNLWHQRSIDKVLLFLTEMQTRLGQAPDEFFSLPMSRHDMADYLGLSIETVSRALTELKERGIIEFDGPRQVKFAQPIDRGPRRR